MKRTFQLTLLLLSIFTVNSIAQNGEWVLQKETDGLKVYLRDASNSNLKEVKIETVFNASVSTIVSLLKDVPVYPEWIYKCTGSKLLKTNSQTSSTYYCKIDFPWPMSDRDFIATSKLWKDPESKRVYLDVKGYPEYIPQKEDIVRIEDIEIHYEFIPQNDGTVKMVYQLHSDPAGSIPSWLVNMVIENGPINTVKGMRRMMSQPKYKNAQLSYLE
ncbi:MAG: START domain-containing protein [Chitinophagales bacterium]|nr:START domain-containing protein [Chitinophagales bacterium]